MSEPTITVTHTMTAKSAHIKVEMHDGEVLEYFWDRTGPGSFKGRKGYVCFDEIEDLPEAVADLADSGDWSGVCAFLQYELEDEY